MNESTMPLDEFMAMGGLVEINRRVLHPVGLALGLDPSGWVTVYTTGDEEGWQYGPGILGEVTGKSRLFAARWAEYELRRRAALGWMVQPLHATDEGFVA